jgi:hypothetical protein
VFVEMDEMGEIEDRVVISEETGDSYFGQENWGAMQYEEVKEISEQEAVEDGYEPLLGDIEDVFDQSYDDDVVRGG